MTVTPPQTIYTLLKNSGILGTVQWPVVIGTMPDDKDQYVSIRRVGGFHEGKIQRTGETNIKPHLQIMVRALTNKDAELKAEEILSYLSAVQRTTITYETNQVYIQAVTIVIPVTFVRQEEKNRRQLFSLTVQVAMREV